VDKVTLVGEVEGQTCIVIDDMIDTAGTLCAAGNLLVENHGAKSVYAIASHGIFSGPAGERIAASKFKKVLTTDSMQITDEFKKTVGEKHVQLPLDLLLAEVIRRIHNKEDSQPLIKCLGLY